MVTGVAGKQKEDEVADDKKETVEQRRMQRLEALWQQHPGRFCWADLALLGVWGPRIERDLSGPRCLHSAAEDGFRCREEAQQHELCWCGGYERIKGKLYWHQSPNEVVPFPDLSEE